MGYSLIKKSLVIGAVILLVSVGAVSTINARYTVSKINENKNISNSNEKSRIVIYSPTDKGMERKEYTLSVEKALELKSRLEEIYKNSETPIEVYKKIASLLEENSLLTDYTPIERLLEKADVMKNDYPLYDALCLLAFTGIGVGVAFGYNMPFFGIDAFLWVAGLYHTMTMSPLGSSDVKMEGPDIVIGISIPYMGFFIAIYYPLIFEFPLVVGAGVSGLTFWLR